MKRLIGTFSVDLPCRVFISGPKETGQREYSFLVPVDEFRICIRLLPDEALRRETEELLVWSVSRAIVVIDGALSEVVPVRPSEAMEDWEQRAIEYNNFFMRMLEQYSLVGARCLNRLLRFFRFCLRNHHATMVYNSAFLSVEWSDELGRAYPFELQFVRPTPDIFYMWYDESILTPERTSELQSYLMTDRYPDLYLELLVDAWAALEQKNERRAVIEGAIACEIAVKATFFGFDTVAAASLEYLEEQARAKVPVIQYLHSVAKRVFGRSFKEEKANEYKHIENLFRVRNKAAHRGLCYFRNENGEVKLVNDIVVGQWLKAVDSMIQWLEDVYESTERERQQLQPLDSEAPNPVPAADV